MTTRYRNAFSGYSGFVSGAAPVAKATQAKASKTVSGRANLSAATKKSPAAGQAQGPRTKAA